MKNILIQLAFYLLNKIFLLVLLITILIPCISNAQGVSIDPTPLRAYNLAIEDIVLIPQLKKVIGTSRKCPSCVKLKLVSRVYFGIMTADTLRPSVYFDEAGKLIAPDVNSVTSYFRCSNLHRWAEDRKGTKKTITILPYVER
ncbi:hypothetical protein [Spirosoma aerophilum]